MYPNLLEMSDPRVTLDERWRSPAPRARGRDGATLKLMLFSDLHLDTPFKWAGPELARARRHALRETLRCIICLAGEHGADALLCGGDLYEHDRFSPDTASFLRQAFADVDMPVYLAPGNHDWEGPRSLYRTVEWSANVHVFRDTHLSPVELADGITLWGAARGPVHQAR